MCQVQKSDTLDLLDRRIIAALQVNARAPFAAVAAVLGEQERTVARRAERLLDSGAVRLTAFVDELRTGRAQPVTLRIAVEPGALDDVARQLCARPDIRAVLAVTGGADLCCDLVAQDQATLHQVLAGELPAITGVRSTSSHAVLRHVKPASRWRLPLLDAAQVRQLQPASEPADTGRVELTDADLGLIAELQADARLSYAELGKRTGITSTTARRWTDRLLASGALTLRAAVEPTRLGLAVEADVWLNVRPDALDAVSRRLATRSEVTYCGVVAGTYAVEALVALPDLTQLYAFLTEVIGAEPDVRDCEPTLVTRAYKRGYLLID